MRKSLIIVCGDPDRKYATYIQQLISAFDDKDDVIVGTQDGSVDAVVWDEKHYLDNMKKLNSSNHILFIGDTAAAKEARCNMDVKFDELGMSYGWLGAQAFMRVSNNALNKDNYGSFKELCAKYGKSFEEELDLRFSPDEASNIGKSVDIDLKSILPDPLGFLTPVLDIASAIAQQGKNAIDMAGQAVNYGGDIFLASEAKDQQYSLLSLIIYMDALPQFLGER